MLIGAGTVGIYIRKLTAMRGLSLILAGVALACALNAALHLVTTVLIIVAVMLMAYEVRRKGTEAHTTI
jgi:hypothetical protein